MPTNPGDRLGPYEILAPIGAGGMGEVWKARDTRLDRIVAIKRIKGHSGHSARFEQEARAIAALNHPHICQIYDVGPDYLVMEYRRRRSPCAVPCRWRTPCGWPGRSPKPWTRRTAKESCIAI